MSSERKLGRNLKRLIAFIASRKAIPKGGGIGDAMHAILTPGVMEGHLGQALVEADAMIALIKTATDNPYGDDEEAICEAILDELGVERPE